ncbi:MAG: universal stress protein, partial [Exilibacterium sp.]
GSNERDWRGEMEDYCQQRLNTLFEERSVIPTSRHIREGHCDRVIIDVADELHANLLVLGSVARSGLSSLFVGNTVEKILDKVECDILCLKPSTYVGKLRQHMLEELKQA